MEEILYPLHNIKEQLTYTPTITRGDMLRHKKHTIVCGMGGSAICVSLLKNMFPDLPLSLHNTYGLPHLEDNENTRIILNSYSGNTEEVLETFGLGTEVQCSIAVISKGGELIRIAELIDTPRIILPEIGVEPRFSIIHQMIGILALMGEHEKLEILRTALSACDIGKSETEGKRLSEVLFGKYIVIYASNILTPIAYLTKTAINEGAKLPCFMNTIPEANHNELQSFVRGEKKRTVEDFAFLYFKGAHEHERIAKRFETMKTLYTHEGFTQEETIVDHTTITSIFEGVLTGYFLATYLAVAYHEEPYQTPCIQEFKKMMSV
jgi:glucose/mannose-6-phosphate isomerase